MRTVLAKLSDMQFRAEHAIRGNKDSNLRHIIMIGGTLISLWLLFKLMRFCMRAIFYFPNYGMPEYPTVIVKSDRDR